MAILRSVLMLLLVFTLACPAYAADYRKTKVAVLDFQQHGNFSTQDVGKIVAEWFTTSLVETGRFEVIERRLMQQIIHEQKFGASGLLDPATASRLGKILGVKTVVTGTVQNYDRVYELNVRLINVETGSIITADHVRAGSTTSLNDLVSRVSSRIIRHFPLDGYVVKRSEEGVMLDLGRQAGVRPGMQFTVFVEGNPVRHPKTGEVLSVDRVTKGTVKITEVREKTSLAVMLSESCTDCVQVGQQVRSSVSDDLSGEADEAKRIAADRKREEAERKELEKREKEARDWERKLDNEARERDRERARKAGDDRKRDGDRFAEKVAQAPISGLSQLFAFPVQNEDIRSLAIAPSGNIAATGDKNGSVLIWDIAKGEQLVSLAGHPKGDVVALEFSHDGRQLLSAGRDKRVVLWDVASRRQIASVEVKDTPTDVEMSRSGRIVAIGSGGRESWIWEPRSNRIRAFKNQDDTLAVAISPDGHLLATGGQSKAITLWDSSTGRQIRSLSGHQKDVRMLSFFGGGKHLVSSGDDKLVIVWDMKNGTHQHILRGHDDNVVHLAVSRDGQMMVSGERRRSGGQIILWDLLKGQEIRRYQVEKRMDLLGMTPDGRQLVITSGKELAVYRID